RLDCADRARGQVSPPGRGARASSSVAKGPLGSGRRFDDAMRIAVVRRYPGCPAGVRALALSLVMLGLIDSAALAPLAPVGPAFPGAGTGVRAGLAVVGAGGVAAAAVIVGLPRLAASPRWLRSRPGR